MTEVDLIVGKIIDAETFMKLFNRATAVDYAGFYMTVQDDDNEIIFLPNCDGVSKVCFPKDIIKDGVFVNRFNDMFRFNHEDCEWFGMLSEIKLS